MLAASWAEAWLWVRLRYWRQILEFPMVSGFLCFYHSWWALSGCVYIHANKPQLERNLVRLKEIKLWDKGHFIKNYKCSHSPGVKPDCPRKHVDGFVWCNLNSGLGLCTLETLSEGGGEAGGPHQLIGAGQLSHWLPSPKISLLSGDKCEKGNISSLGEETLCLRGVDPCYSLTKQGPNPWFHSTHTLVQTQLSNVCVKVSTYRYDLILCIWKASFEISAPEAMAVIKTKAREVTWLDTVANQLPSRPDHWSPSTVVFPYQTSSPSKPQYTEKLYFQVTLQYISVS